MNTGLARPPNKAGQRSYVWAASVIILLLIFGSYLRFHDNNHKLFWYDEVHSALWYSGHNLQESFAELAGREVGVEELRDVQRLDQDSDLRSVVETIIGRDPQHTPLYYLALNLWAKVTGDSIGALRSLSAVANLLMLPLLFWLCLELSGSSRAAWIAVTLVAISPFHIVYSQEARQYTFFLLMVVAASSSLLWTLRSPTSWKWCLYAVSLAAGLYTHLLFCFVIGSHAVYVFASECIRSAGEPKRIFRGLIAYSAATAGGILLFSPWMWVMTAHYQTAINHLSWSSTPVSLSHLAGMWGYNYSAVFLDTNHIFKFLDQPGLLVYGAFLLRGLCLIPAVMAMLLLMRHPLKKCSLFLLPLILLPFLGLALPDLIFGGMRSGGGNRYLAPSFLGLEIAMALWFAQAWTEPGGEWRRTRLGMLVFILVMGIVSGLIFRNSDTWWHKTIGHYNMSVARIVNQGKSPLLIANSPTALLSLSHTLEPRVRILYTGGDQWPEFPNRFSDVFILQPSRKQMDQIESEQLIKMEEVFSREGLYKITTR